MAHRRDYRKDSDRQRYYKEQRQDYQSSTASAPAWIMPIGLYKGNPLADIPTDYLKRIRQYIRSTGLLIRIANEIERRARIVRNP